MKNQDRETDNLLRSALTHNSRLLRRYRDILRSKAVKSVFHSAQIHGMRYRGEVIDEREVDHALSEAATLLNERDTPDTRPPVSFEIEINETSVHLYLHAIDYRTIQLEEHTGADPAETQVALRRAIERTGKSRIPIRVVANQRNATTA